MDDSLAASPTPPQGGAATPSVLAVDRKPSLDNSFKVLASVQEQIRFADTKAAFVFALNTLMFGFVAGGVGTVKKELALVHTPLSAWVALVALVLFGIFSVIAVTLLATAVMSRFGEKAPPCRIFFGHIVTRYGHNYDRFVSELN